MYIPYNKIQSILRNSFLNFKSLDLFLENLRIKQNIRYIAKNRNGVLKKLRNKVKTEKLVVAFYVYFEEQWKCQSLYDLLDKSNNFIPYIIVTKNSVNKDYVSYHTDEHTQKTYNFFKNKNMRVFYGYDFKQEKHIPFEALLPRPDIIIYQHPWHVETSQGPVKTSEFALSYYVPYFLATSTYPGEYYLRFHQYVQTHYVIDEQVKKYFSEHQTNKCNNLTVVGHPQLDYFYLNKDKNYQQNEYVIYAPHWSFDNKNKLNWGTFLWSGEAMLEFAKNHTEYNWVFRPHPVLKKSLKLSGWSEEKIEEYWSDWSKLGVVAENGDYLDMFMESKMMITDCGSFQTEYFMTNKPVIYLKSENGVPFNPTVQMIVNTYYTVNNRNELQEALQKCLLDNIDEKYLDRINLYNSLGYRDNFAAQNILDNICSTLCIKN